MNLPALCIRRPVFTVMLVALPVVLGLISVRNIGVDLFPNVELPVVMVTTTRAGASVEEMETGVTKVIEEAINTCEGIEELRSVTTEGLSFVSVQFLLERNRDSALQDVQSKVNSILARLPGGTDTPVIDRFDVDAAPVMSIAVSGDRSLREITEIADQRIRENLSALQGVGAVILVGGQRRAVNLTVDADRLQAYGLSIEQVAAAIAARNRELPGGRVAEGPSELVLRTMGRVELPEEFADLIVSERSGEPIRLRDLGEGDVAADGFEEPRSLARLDGVNAVSLVIQKQSGSNSVEVIDAVKQRLAELERGFPAEGLGDLELQVVRDQSRFIKASLHEVQLHSVLGAVLVILSILLFLRDWRSTIIAGIAIPVSVIAVFPALEALDLTLNNITLIALVLVIGVVVDDAIIVIENVFRWMEEEGVPPREAALEGTAEILDAVVTTTLSLAVIFLPIAFMSGTVGRFLSSFGITCAVAILVSLGVSLTLTPMLCARLLKPPRRAQANAERPKRGAYARLVEAPYLWLLTLAMRRRLLVVLIAAAVVASVPRLVRLVGFDFVPKDDQSEFEVAVTTPEGWSLERVGEVFRVLESRLLALPEVTHVFTEIGETSGREARGQGAVTKGSLYVRLFDLGQRHPEFTQEQVMQRVRRMLGDFADLRASVQIPAALSSGAANADVEFQITGPDQARLSDYAARMIETLRQTEGLVDVDTTLALRKPELRVAVDRERAADLGVPLDSIAATLNTLVGGRIVSDWKDAGAGEQYDVWLRARGVDRGDAAAVGRLTVPAADGTLVRIDNLAALVEAQGPAQIDRAQRQRKISIVANLHGLPTGAAAEAFRGAFAALDAPPAYALSATGRAKRQAESIQAFFLAFVLSLLFMYMILAAQFESFVHPITILLAVPLTIPFALLSLYLLGTPLTLFSVLGVFLLFGIVKKNGILQVDSTNVLRRRLAADPNLAPPQYRAAAAPVAAARSGFARYLARLAPEQRLRLYAIIEANRMRLRPILMTTVVLVVAMIPIALGKGPGAANRADMAKVIVGGQAMSLLLSLLVTPVAYSLFDDFAGWFRRRKT